MVLYSLVFSGGFDLAAEWAGWDNIFHCEINPFGQKVLKHYWPDSIQYHDITKTDFTIHRGTIDVLTGGFPCQPYSQAGKRLGKEDERHLWPEMLRAIREIQPRWVVGENVRGLITWNGGLVFDEVQADLEAAGYEVLPFLLPASGVNAPHERYRIWFVAYAAKNGRGTRRSNSIRKTEDKTIRTNILKQSKRFSKEQIITNPTSSRRKKRIKNRRRKNAAKNTTRMDIWAERLRNNGDAADTCDERFQRNKQRGSHGERNREETFRPTSEPLEIRTWHNWPTQSPVSSRNDGFSRPLFRYLNQEIYDRISTTSEENRIQNLSEVWEEIQQEKIWEKIRRFYSLESKDILLQTMRLYQAGNIKQNELSPFSEIVSQIVLSKLRKYGEFRRSPQGQKLQKQRSEQLGDIMSYLPHEIPLAAKTFETAMSKFETWHRNESIKAYGNAIVPQVVYQIFKAINHYEQTK